MAKLISASFDKPTLTVDYVADDGSHLLRNGGTIAWRFNNPGNIRPAKTNVSLRIGTGKTASGEFCIFPSYEIGRRAKKELLRRKYNQFTIPEAMEVYAPRSENDTDSYIEHIIKKTNLPRSVPLSSLTDDQFDALMDAMESKEGFNAKANTRNEKWVHTTTLTLSDGARPIADEDVKIRINEKEYTTKTNCVGTIPPIVHLTSNDQVEILLKTQEGNWKSAHTFVTGKISRQLLATRDQQKFQGVARISPTRNEPNSFVDQKPLIYIVKSGDNLTKIAKKFKTTAGDLRKLNNGIIKSDLIFPGQKINIYGNAGVHSPILTSKPTGPTQKPGQSEPTIPVRSSKGQPLALVDHKQRQAPWMEVAIREAKQWAGTSESNITKIDNYHKEISVSGELDTVPWCASFVNYALKDAGYPYEKSAGSQFPTWSKHFVKIDKPVYGALMVWQKGKQGHVAFAYGKDTISGEVIALGGNQNDKITFMLKSETTKTFKNYYIPKVYEEMAKLQNELSSYDIVELNKAITGNPKYKRRATTRDR